MKRRFIIFNEMLLWVEGSVAALLSLIILVAIFWQVLCRYVFMISTPWSEELARYLFICLSYIGAGVGVYHAQFVSIDLVDKILDWKSKKAEEYKLMVEKASLVLTLIFLVYFGRLYWAYLQNIARLGQRSAAMRINMLFPMSSIMIGTICMTIHGFCRLITSKEERIAVKTELKVQKEEKAI